MEELLYKLRDAFNKHDIDLFTDCFEADYDSKQPVHPARAFRGRDQARENWIGNFNEMPDFSARLLIYALYENTIWAEWEWLGTRKDESKLHMCGVTIFGVKNGRIQWGRLYMEPVEANSADINTAVKEVMQGKKE